MDFKTTCFDLSRSSSGSFLNIMKFDFCVRVTWQLLPVWCMYPALCSVYTHHMENGHHVTIIHRNQTSFR